MEPDDGSPPVAVWAGGNAARRWPSERSPKDSRRHHHTIVAAVRSCHTAGIDVKMITGDHAATATAIAEQPGILTDDEPGRVLTGATTSWP